MDTSGTEPFVRHELEWDIAAETLDNTAFSLSVPGLQLAIDSTSLGEFKLCARRYFYAIVLGFRRPHNVHLDFGLILHRAVEIYHHARAAEADHQTGLRSALRFVLEATWDPDRSRPVTWLDDSVKNRLSLVRTVVWYLDKWEHDPIRTVLLADGRPAVELHFEFDSGLRSISSGEPFLLCGYFDRLGELNGEVFIPDVKTTKSSLSQSFFDKFTPDNQMSLYVLAGKVVWKQPIKGAIIDAAQVAVTFSDFQRGLVTRSDAQLSEWYADLGSWLGKLEAAARSSHWEMNDTACGLYGGCHFREVCSQSPNARKAALEAKFVRRKWNPLEARTDI